MHRRQRTDRGRPRGRSHCLAARRIAALAGALAALAAAPAAAADIPLKAPPVAPAPASWTQAYAGFGLGFDAETGRTDFVLLGGGPGATLDGVHGADLGLTATIGFDVQVAPRVVVGGFADYDWSHQTTTITGAGSGIVLGVTTPTLHDGWTVGGRAGVLVTPDVLLYGLAGYSRMLIDDWTFTAGPGGFVLTEPGLHSHGLALGAGIEYRLADNLSLRGEYRHVALGSITSVDPLNGIGWTSNLSEHVVRLVAAYRFGVPGLGAAPAAPAVTWTSASTGIWTGFYGGLGIGGDAIAPHMSGTAGNRMLDVSGLAGGDVGGTVVVGYDREVLPRWVVGAFGLIDFGSNGGRQFTVNAGPFGAITTDVSSVERSWTAGGRAGFLLAPDTLVYALAGYTGTTFHAITYNIGVASGTGQSPEFHGPTFGAGFEKLFTPNISARLEYRHTQLDSIANIAAPGFSSLTIDAGVHTARLVVAYRLPTR